MKSLKSFLSKFLPLLFLAAWTHDFAFAEPSCRPIQLHGLWGYIDQKGQWFKKPQFSWATEFSEGLALVIQEGKLGKLDRNGGITWMKERSPFVSARPYRNGLAVIYVDQNYGYVNQLLQMVVPPQYHNAQDFHQDHAIVRKNKNIYVIGKTGKTVLQVPYEVDTEYSEGLIGVAKGSMDKPQCGYMNLKGEMVIPFKFSRVFSFKDGFAVAGITKPGGIHPDVDGLYGVIDKKGGWVLEPTFDFINAFSDGLAMTNKGDLIGFIDLKGNWVIPPVFSEAESFKDGLAPVRLQGFAGMIDKTGHFVIPPSYKSIQHFINGLAVAQLSTLEIKYEQALIDRSNRMVFRWYGDDER